MSEVELIHDALRRALGELYQSSSDVHKHKCPSCSHIWEHDRANIHSREQNEREHTCPNCGLEDDLCYNRYQGAYHEPIHLRRTL